MGIADDCAEIFGSETRKGGMMNMKLGNDIAGDVE
jgi:hypothetical protein